MTRQTSDQTRNHQYIESRSCIRKRVLKSWRY